MNHYLEFPKESREGRMGLDILHSIGGYLPFPRSLDELEKEKVAFLRSHPDAKPGEIAVQFYGTITYIGPSNKNYPVLERLFESNSS